MSSIFLTENYENSFVKSQEIRRRRTRENDTEKITSLTFSTGMRIYKPNIIKSSKIHIDILLYRSAYPCMQPGKG